MRCLSVAYLLPTGRGREDLMVSFFSFEGTPTYSDGGLPYFLL